MASEREPNQKVEIAAALAFAILDELEKRYDRPRLGQHLARSVTLWAIKTRPSPGWKRERVQFKQMRHEPRGIDLIRRMGLNP